MSIDLLPTELPTSPSSYHIEGDVLQFLSSTIDLMVAHPPCTFLASSGARWSTVQRTIDQGEALAFFKRLWDAPIERIAIENPIGIVSQWRKPDQIIQPWQFGHAETKATCLWLKNLPRLKPTHTRPAEVAARVHTESPTPDRWKNRSRTLQGIADAMAEQWSTLE